MRSLFSLLSLIVILASCSKDDTNDPQPGPTNTNQLVVDKSFNWSSSTQGTVSVTLVEHPEVPMVLDGGLLYIQDAVGNRIGQSRISGNEASFEIALPALNNGAQFYLPATGESWPFDKLGSVQLNMINPLDSTLNSGKKEVLRIGKTSVISIPGSNILGNADFEINDFNDNNGTGYDPSKGTVDDGKWYLPDNDYTWSTENGSKVLKAKNNRWTYAFQLHSVTAGDSIYFGADMSGTIYTFLFFYDVSDNLVGWSRTTFGTGTQNLVKGAIPSGATTVSALFNFEDKDWVDNAFLHMGPAVVDTDNDGVEDSNDDFPNDPARAYLTHFPTSGKQTVAFEDLWPNKGDYDFNDLIASSTIALTQDANLEWVSGDFVVSLDAVGAGYKSGLAIRLVDASKAPMADIIGSITGDAVADPNVTNGIIVFSDPDQFRSQYYTNTENDKMGIPDTARFTINFGSNDGSAFYPDIYIFRTDERGREVHLPGYSGTSEADLSLYNTADDVNGTYKTVNGLPWGMELIFDGTNFKHPREKVDMITAYPQFGPWASSEGGSNNDWYLFPSTPEVIDLQQ